MYTFMPQHALSTLNTAQAYCMWCSLPPAPVSVYQTEKPYHMSDSIATTNMTRPTNICTMKRPAPCPSSFLTATVGSMHLLSEGTCRAARCCCGPIALSAARRLCSFESCFQPPAFIYNQMIV
eukprot:6854-Heterococcus_DN1.PRE.1